MASDDIAEAVLARADVARFIEGGHGLTSDAARTRVMGYLEELRTTQRYELYRALEYPLYPILRKIERVGEQQHLAVEAAASGRVVYASNHRSHTDYLVEPLVLDDAGIRPPIIAAGINLFGGPLGLIHKHVTGRAADPPQHQGPGVPHHAQGLRQRAAAQARPVLLSRRAAAATAAS